MSTVDTAPLQIENELLAEIHNLAKEEENNNLLECVPPPSKTSPEWSDYVLSQFSDAEVVVQYHKTTKQEVGRYPKVNGLRRIARMYVGDIVESYPTPVQTTYAPHDGYVCACFTYTVIFSLPDGTHLKFADVGEIISCPSQKDFTNIDVKFGRFPSSIAVTRAEARTLRKALGLNTVAFEELNMDQSKSEQSDSPLYATDFQKQSIKVFCKKNLIDVTKYLKSGPYNYDDLNQVSFSHAANMCKQLESFQRPEGKLSEYKTQYNISL